MIIRVPSGTHREILVYSLYIHFVYTFRVSEAMKSRITKWGNSLAIRIPRSLGREIELKEGTEVDLIIREGAIIITPVSSNYSLDDLVQGITAENRHTETDWGEPKGAEVW